MQFGQAWNEADPDHAPIRLDQTIAEIKSVDADVIFLQEVERAEPGGTQPIVPPNYARLRSALPDYDSAFELPRADPRELPFGIGQAIFSRTELHDKTRIILPSPPVEFEFHGEKKTPTDRLLVGALTRIDGREVRLFNAHLLAFFMLHADGEKHRGQREQVLEELRKSEEPTILSGDFNVVEHAALVAQFATAGYHTVQASQPTWRRRPYVLDHIFHNRALRAVSREVRPTPASDHHLVVAEFDW